jgi:hypothetical protein
LGQSPETWRAKNLARQKLDPNWDNLQKPGAPKTWPKLGQSPETWRARNLARQKLDPNWDNLQKLNPKPGESPETSPNLKP